MVEILITPEIEPKARRKESSGCFFYINTKSFPVAEPRRDDFPPRRGDFSEEKSCNWPSLNKSEDAQPKEHLGARHFGGREIGAPLSGDAELFWMGIKRYSILHLSKLSWLNFQYFPKQFPSRGLRRSTGRQ